jgi:hypothetical protein
MTYVTVIVPGVYNDPNHRNHPFAEAGEVIEVASGGYADSLIADGFVSLAANPTAVRVTNPLRPPHELPFTVLGNLDGHTHLAAGARLYLRFPVPDGCHRGVLYIAPHSASGSLFAGSTSGYTAPRGGNSYPAHLPFYARHQMRTVSGTRIICMSMYVETNLEECTSIEAGGQAVTGQDIGGHRVLPATYSTGQALLGWYSASGGVFVTSTSALQVVECAWIDPTARELIIAIRSVASSGGPFALTGELFFQW